MTPPSSARQDDAAGRTCGRRPYSLLQIRDPQENRLPIDRFAETLLVVVEGSLTVV